MRLCFQWVRSHCNPQSVHVQLCSLNPLSWIGVRIGRLICTFFWNVHAPSSMSEHIEDGLWQVIERFCAAQGQTESVQTGIHGFCLSGQVWLSQLVYELFVSLIPLWSGQHRHPVRLLPSAAACAPRQQLEAFRCGWRSKERLCHPLAPQRLIGYFSIGLMR